MLLNLDVAQLRCPLQFLLRIPGIIIVIVVVVVGPDFIIIIWRFSLLSSLFCIYIYIFSFIFIYTLSSIQKS